MTGVGGVGGVGNVEGVHVMQTYRNAIGVAASSSIESVGGVEAAENGVGLMNEDYLWWPDIAVRGGGNNCTWI